MAHRLYQLLQFLDRVQARYVLSRHRDDTVMVTVTLVGQRIEIEIFEDEHIEFSRFSGDESVESRETEIEQLLEEIRNWREE